MEKILLINGSPRGAASNTHKATQAFLDEMNRFGEYEVEEIICSQANISACKGCLTCWKNESGTCCIQDDMAQYIQKYVAADILIWSFPNFIFGVPSDCKKFMDRLLPINYPQLEKTDAQHTKHPKRYTLHYKKVFVFCSCGFYNIDANMDAIKKQFEILYGDLCDMILIPEGQLLSNRFLQWRTADVFASLRQAGASYAKTQTIPSELLQSISKPVMDIDSYLRYIDASTVTRTAAMTDEEYRLEKVRAFFRSLVLTYDPSVLAVPNSVLEIQILDIPYEIQLILTNTDCTLIEDKSQFEQFRLKVVSNFAFFAGRPQLTETTNNTNKQPDLNKLIFLINKFEKAGVRKTMRFS